LDGLSLNLLLVDGVRVLGLSLGFCKFLVYDPQLLDFIKRGVDGRSLLNTCLFHDALDCIGFSLLRELLSFESMDHVGRALK